MCAIYASAREMRILRLSGKNIGFAFTGSHCRVMEVISEVRRLKEEGARVVPIYSPVIDTTSNRFYEVDDFKDIIAEITGEKPITSMVAAEPVGPLKLFDVLVMAPASGNSIAKLANGITDTPVLMASKAHLRNERPLVIAVSTNDGLGINGKNILTLASTKNVYLVPFGQDDPNGKHNSLVARMDMITDTVLYALEGKQIQPMIVEAWKYQPNAKH